MAEKKAVKKKKNLTYLVAASSASTTIDGIRMFISQGQTFSSTHPAVKQFPSLFVEPAEYARRTGQLVEQATAAPGEVRNVAIPEA